MADQGLRERPASRWSDALLERVLDMAKSATRSVNWAVEVASRMRGVDFPLDEDEARKRLKGIWVGERPIGDYLESMDFPISTPAGLLHQISKQTGGGKVRDLDQA